MENVDRIILCPNCKGEGKIVVGRPISPVIGGKLTRRQCPKCKGMRVMKEVTKYVTLTSEEE